MVIAERTVYGPVNTNLSFEEAATIHLSWGDITKNIKYYTSPDPLDKAAYFPDANTRGDLKLDANTKKSFYFSLEQNEDIFPSFHYHDINSSEAAISLYFHDTEEKRDFFLGNAPPNSMAAVPKYIASEKDVEEHAEESTHEDNKQEEEPTHVASEKDVEEHAEESTHEDNKQEEEPTHVALEKDDEEHAEEPTHKDDKQEEEPTNEAEIKKPAEESPNNSIKKNAVKDNAVKEKNDPFYKNPYFIMFVVFFFATICIWIWAIYFYEEETYEESKEEVTV